MRYLLLFFVTAQTFTAQAAESYFDLYSQGKVIESVEALKQELATESFNTLTLSSQFQILTSAYYSHLAISDELAIDVLKAIHRQLLSHRNGQGLATQVAIFLDELQTFLSQDFSLKAVDSQLKATLARGKDTSIIPNDRHRLTKIQIIGLVAHRKFLEAKIPGDKIAWLFLAGKAGFYRFNTGNKELSMYIEVCQERASLPSCGSLKEAREMFELGQKL